MTPDPPLRLEDLQTPVLVIRIERVRANLARMLESLQGYPNRWRPHVKTTKVPEVLDELLAAGVSRFKCATTREARVLLERSAAPLDLLVAMAHRGANLERLRALAEAFPHHRVSVLSEDPDHAREVTGGGTALAVFVDQDPGWHRSGIPLDQEERLRATVEAAGAALRGLHFYEGQVRQPDPAERAATCQGLYQRFLEVARTVLGPHLAGMELVTSGTPTFEAALAFAGFRGLRHTVGPGTVVYWDLTSEGFQVPGFQCAATVLTRVISAPEPGLVTCDAGSKAVDAAAGDPCCAVVSWPGLEAATPSEEHLPLRAGDGRTPEPGALLELLPRHVCPTINLADEAVLLEGGEVRAIVPVAARGHEAAPAVSVPVAAS